jgi:hypothetical protein
MILILRWTILLLAKNMKNNLEGHNKYSREKRTKIGWYNFVIYYQGILQTQRFLKNPYFEGDIASKKSCKSFFHSQNFMLLMWRKYS